LLRWRGRFAWLTTLAKALAAELQHHPQDNAEVFKVELGQEGTTPEAVSYPP